jgi:hypothetical protein
MSAERQRRRLDRLAVRAGADGPFPWLARLSNVDLAELAAALSDQVADEPGTPAGAAAVLRGEAAEHRRAAEAARRFGAAEVWP